MRYASRFVALTFAALSPLAARGQVAGKHLALDFRTSTSIDTTSDAGVLTGHMVASANKVRIDMSVAGAGAPTPLSTDGPVSMIVSDSGKTIVYLDAKNNQYMRFRPAEIFASTQQLGGVQMNFSGTEAKVDNLGPGPSILGHPTRHYRMQIGMTMTISMMGQQESVRIASTTDSYYATDIATAFNPFASLGGTDMMSMFGSRNRDFATKMDAAQKKLPRSPPLRSSTVSAITTGNETKRTKTSTEVTSIRWVNADPKIFEIPSNYTAVELPSFSPRPNP